MFTHRSSEKELIDLGPPYYTIQEFQHCQVMLFRINKFLGIFKNTIKLLKHFPKDAKVLDVGCGAGLFLLNLSQQFPAMQFNGIDISHEAIQIARQELELWKNKNPDTDVAFQLLDNTKINLPENSVDIILLTLVCHHLSDDEIISTLPQLLAATRQVVIINDLQRHPIAYFIYRWLSPLLFRNRLITHDGLISIKRGFVHAELKALLHKAGIKKYQIKWHFPFRWRVLLWKN